MNNIFNLKNKVAIVTGGASYLGSTISLILAEYGAEVIAIGRKEETLKELKLKNKSIKYRVCDILDEKKFSNTIDDIIKTYGKIDILVNNAYSGDRKTIEELDKTSWNKSLEDALTVYFLPCKYVGKYMIQQGSGSIINMASLWSFLAPDHRMYLDLKNNISVHYAVSRGGTNQLTRYLSSIWAKYNIRVNSLTPGLFPKKRGIERLDYINELTRRIPMGRVGIPKDLEGSIILLASDASSYITGQNIIIDGGYSVW